MACVCETCKVKEKYKYWHDVPLRKHQFMKIMLGNFKNQLRIPRKFVECFMGDLSHSCTLRGKSGNVWEVQIVHTEVDVFFSNGWENFRRDHGLKEGYLLVFRYVGDSSFEVSVFDVTACEHEGSYFTKNMKMSSDSSCRSLLHLDKAEGSQRGTFSAANKGKEKVDEMSESINRNNPASNFENTDTLELENSSDEEIQKGLHNLRQRSRKRSGSISQKCYISKRRAVTKHERLDAKYKARSHYMSRATSTRRRMFEIIMKPTQVYRDFHLTITKEWAVKHMPSESQDVILQVSGVEGSWMVRYRWTPPYGQCQINSGWSTFVLENNLEEGDVCLFELVPKGESEYQIPVFVVYIFRVVEEVVPLTESRRCVS